MVHVGIAIGSGTDKETSDIILLKDDIRDVVGALDKTSHWIYPLIGE